MARILKRKNKKGGVNIRVDINLKQIRNAFYLICYNSKHEYRM